MIRCICIDDSARPNEVPVTKWPKKGELYHIIYTVTVLPQVQIAVSLSEIELTESELPYEYFLLKRFAIDERDVRKLIQLIKDCSETDLSANELIQQVTTLQEVEQKNSNV